MNPNSSKTATLNSVELVNSFIEAINNQNITQIITLLDEDHLFINSQDKKLSGKENVIRAWLKYFELFPDYHIEAEQIVASDDMIAIFGYSSGTYKNLADKSNLNYWRLPSSWKVSVQNSLITKWQVYTDNFVPFEIIRRNNMNGHVNGN